MQLLPCLCLRTWVVVKIMVSSSVPIIIRGLIYGTEKVTIILTIPHVEAMGEGLFSAGLSVKAFQQAAKHTAQSERMRERLPVCTDCTVTMHGLLKPDAAAQSGLHMRILQLAYGHFRHPA